MADLATLTIRLAEAEIARHKLKIGSLGEKMEHGDMSLQYTRANAGELDTYIDQLNAQIAAAGGGGSGLRRRGLVVDL